MSETFEPGQPKSVDRSNWRILRNLFYAGVLIVALTAVAVQQIAGALSQPIYVVNGIDREISVTVDGTEQTIAPFDSVQVAAAGMPFTVGVNSDFLDRDEVVVDVESSFFSRLLSPQTIIVDPTEIAVLVWNEFPYIQDGKNYTDEELDPYYDHRVYYGEASYVLDKVDFPFEVAPERIDNVIDISLRSEILNESNFAPEDILYYLQERIGDEVLEDYILRRFRYEPVSLPTLEALYEWTDASTFMEAARPRIGEFGDRVDLHRYYQSAATYAMSEEAVRADYEALLSENPDDAMWHYLMGRLHDNSPEARAHWERALELDPNFAYAHLGLGYLALQFGDTESALVHAERANAIDPDSYLFAVTLRNACLYNRDFERAAQLALEQYESVQPRDDIDLDAMDIQAQALARSGNADRMRARIDEIFDWIESDMRAAKQDDPTGTAEYVRDYLLQTVQYIEAGGENLSAIAEEFGSEIYATEQHLLDGNFAALPSFEEGLERQSWKFQLVFAISKKLHGHDEAAKHLAEAAALMREYGSDYVEYADLLEGTRPFDPEHALQLSLDPSDRALVFAALIAFDDRYRADLADVARTLNLPATVPEYLINRVLDAPAG